MDPTKMMSRRFRRYRGGEDAYGVPPTNEPPKPGMFSSFKMPSFGSSNTDPNAPPGEKKGLLGIGMLGLGGGSRRRRSSKRSLRRKSSRKRRR